ncbi:MAG TPA: BatA domain-containing protein, partial [Gemmatimonadaceae bacterium]
MTWTTPLLLLGLAITAVPVLIHLVSRRRANVTRFPSLRFVPASRLIPRRVVSLTDTLLMAIRAAIVALAALALAGPMLQSRREVSGTTGVGARVVVIDTSPSMQRPLGSSVGLAVASRIADSLAATSAIHRILPTTDVASVLAGASAWLAAQTGPKSLNVLSDFQIGSLDSTNLAVVERGIET